MYYLNVLPKNQCKTRAALNSPWQVKALRPLQGLFTLFLGRFEGEDQVFLGWLHGQLKIHSGW